MAFRHELMDHYIYLNENQAVSALMDFVVAGVKPTAPILITGGPNTGKSHLCAALYDMIENQTETLPIPPKAMIMGGESLGNLLLAARESPCQGNQPLKKIASPLLIDDLHLFPFSSTKASARLESFLQRHQVVIATSQKPIEELPKDFFKEWGHIRLKEITRPSAEVILRDFTEQYNIRLSALMVKILLQLYEAQDLSLSQMKDVLIKGKLKQREEGLLITHERSFHTLFRDYGLDRKVQRLILDEIFAKEQLIRIANAERERKTL